MFRGYYKEKSTLEDDINQRIAITGKVSNSIRTNFLKKKIYRYILKNVKEDIVKNLANPILT